MYMPEGNYSGCWSLAQTGSVWCLTPGLEAAGMKYLPAVDAFTQPNKNTKTSCKFPLAAAGACFLSCLLWVSFDGSSIALRADVFHLPNENRQRLSYLKMFLHTTIGAWS